MLWEIDVHPRASGPNRLAEQAAAAAQGLTGGAEPRVFAASGYLLQGRFTKESAAEAARLLADPVVEEAVIASVGAERLNRALDRHLLPDVDPVVVVHVLPKPGVMDPVAESAAAAIRDLGLPIESVRAFRKYWFQGLSQSAVQDTCRKALANDAIEQVLFGPLQLEQLELGTRYTFDLATVPLLDLREDGQLLLLSRQRQLSLSLAEMRTIQAHFAELQREPTDIELETIAQTWSEHCSHKTLAGRIAYRDENGERRFENMLKETIFAATQHIRRQPGKSTEEGDDWCVSVFKDNAGIVRFDDDFNVCFKVETHNHPSAIEPYGGANTGLGGVIRDVLGTGLGAKPVCSTDVFCFAPPDTPADALPPGVLHPKRVMHGVVSGVRDYGNRMGIPTVNGAVYFDERYLGNPLVYCGNVGLIPRDKSFKQPRPHDLIVALGGRTGRDGIHGATFSSIQLDSHSEAASGGAVQIGNAITEKMLADVVLAARDRGLFTAITDCGAGGFSSAVGEMGEEIGAEVQLEAAPLKYAGLSYTEIWISEAQERMVLAVPEKHWPEFRDLAASEGVEATVLGRFVPTGRLKLKYGEHEVADLSMQFLHHGRPPVVREAVYAAPPTSSISNLTSEISNLKSQISDSPSEISNLKSEISNRKSQIANRKSQHDADFTDDLLSILSSLNVASKEWIIRQYDHEVQAGSVIKPLVGAKSDGPSDAAVVRPVLGSQRGLVIACGMNPRYGDLDPYHMAASAIDEAVRNCVAVGADPARIAILDNFCWGNTDRPETLGSLVRAALGCHDTAIALGTPFISGKDSLNNEFHYQDSSGNDRAIAIPPSLLISALGQIADVRKAVTMDFKEPGNSLYLVGATHDELGGSHFSLVRGETGGNVPRVDGPLAKATFAALHRAIDAGLVRACHDLSEGGLAVAAAEMAFAGGLGAKILAENVACSQLDDDSGVQLLFSESNTRFLCEVRVEHAAAFELELCEIPHARIGQVTGTTRLRIGLQTPESDIVRHPHERLSEWLESAVTEQFLIVDADTAALKEAWQRPLREG